MTTKLLKDTTDWVETFVEDIFDKDQFKKAFIKVLKPIGKKRFEKAAFDPYPYQSAWSHDETSLKFVAKSRQVGFTLR